MARRIYIYVPGILTFPGASDNWSGRAVTFTQTRTFAARAEKVEYFCGPIGRAFGQEGRAQKLAAVLKAYAGWEIILVGHSNGCAVILKALADLDWPMVDALHLVCGACEADFDRNGLNGALGNGRVQEVHVYAGGKDAALRLAHSIPGRLLGYGVLGLHGAVNVRPAVAGRIRSVTWPEFGHSDAWLGDNFEATMAYLFCAELDWPAGKQ